MKIQDIMETDTFAAARQAGASLWDESTKLSRSEWEATLKQKFGDVMIVKDQKYHSTAYKPGTSQVLGTITADMNYNYTRIRK